MATSTDPKPPPRPASPTLQTFHAFPYLPYELRAEIWRFSTIEPRDIIPSIHYRPHPLLPPHRTMPILATCFTDIPALLHVCRESREIGLKIYQRAGCPDFISPAMLWQHKLDEEARAEESRRLPRGKNEG
ncbi:hypothetical protein QBC40DRAFT_255449 [Triangularia verruculosa]|uniref:2EXR domain-containing protein n=1 Tax=Triangularia verruculosa TaxID=2587418 RepID=A0AAN7AUF4_9PEZI|nr:hypothetical protein QBC40DRAFT_255449 [Triangularia verruculosa]